MPASPFSEMQLTTNPFSPEIKIAGQLVRLDYLRELSPKNGMPENYYFDHYNWKDEDQIGRIDAMGRIKQFPENLSKPGMIVVISGASQTGRTSLENLLLFEVETRFGTKPIVTSLTVDISLGLVTMAQNFAFKFVTRVEDYLADLGRAQEGEALSKKLQDIITAWKANLIPGETNSDFLFDQLNDRVRRVLPDTPMVFCLNATSHINTADAWSPPCFMLLNLANFVIVSLTKSDHAAILRTSLRDRHIRAAWVDAPRIGAEQVTHILTNRLTSVRTVPGGQELFPFTEGAIRTLFASTRPGETITLSIGVAIKKLKGALDKKCADLQAVLANPPPTGIPKDRLEITDADMKNYFAS